MENKNIKRCPDCGKIACVYTGFGPLSLPANLPKSAPRTGNWHSFIARKCCPSCAAARRTTFNQLRQRRYRRSRRAERRELKSTISKQSKAIKRAETLLNLCDEKIAALESQVAQLKAQNRAAYQQDTRRGGISFFRH